MEKAPSPSPSSSMDASMELQCVGRLEVVPPKPVGFLCGSIPVPTDKAFHTFNSALIPSGQTVSAPRYRMLPTETDLNRPPLVSNFTEKVLPIAAAQAKASGDITWEGGAVTSNLNRKSEALAVAGLAEYGDEIDVIAPADILKQIFKIPYSKARLSIAVRRVGQALVLNSGPDVEEGEKLVRRHNSQSKCADQSLFLNFAMHSVRMEACDCPPSHHASSQGHLHSSVLPDGDTSDFLGQSGGITRKEGFSQCSDYQHIKHDRFVWESKKGKRNNSRGPVKKASHVSEKSGCSMQESEKHKRACNDEFLRVLFWQFHNFRMLLGSDLLLFSNEKYVAVSLHLWDVTRQVTPLTWLEAWLDNIMASVPELAICYHENGVVRGYELLKTDDIFLLKGISEDGTPAFHPHVVQQNGLSVLRFLQENCKQDPGAYWLYKSAGEDVIQLFDLSIIPTNHSSSDCDDSSSSLPFLMQRGRSDSLFSLGTLLYRTAHRLSLSMVPNNKAKCASFIRKCLDFLDDPDHLVVRALAHEQFARLILNYDEELDLASETLPGECKIVVTDAEEEPLDPLSNLCEPMIHKSISSLVVGDSLTGNEISSHNLVPAASVRMTLEANVSAADELVVSLDPEGRDQESSLPNSISGKSFALCQTSPISATAVQTISDPISSKLAAVHHVSQAIKSLRWMRQLQTSEPELIDRDCRIHERSPPSTDLSVCACGDPDCIEVCDIRDWLLTSKLDLKLWKLVLLLGESYLALGQAYKDSNQLHQALKTVELACSIYGSMPQHLEDTRFVSSMVKCVSSRNMFSTGGEKTSYCVGDVKDIFSSDYECLSYEQLSSTYLFWAKAWTLVADVYVEFHMMEGKDISLQSVQKPQATELRMSSEVVKEVQRLKKKLGQYNQNCSLCSLVNCSCQSDRASSGSSASSSSGDARSVAYGRKHSKKSPTKSALFSFLGDPEDDCGLQKSKNRNPGGGHLQQNNDGDSQMKMSKIIADDHNASLMATNNSEIVDPSSEMNPIKFTVAPETEITSRETCKEKSGGIFRYLIGPVVGDTEYNLLAAVTCYDEARKALDELPIGSAELQSVMKKKGWVYNELGRIRLERKELSKAELAFADAINSFREVSDHVNIILINCNLGHGRRALAEEVVSKIEGLKAHAMFHNAYKQALDTATVEYSEALRYYGAAKKELNVVTEDGGSLSNSLRSEVYTQFAHTHLRLGMLLAREDMTAEVYENGVLKGVNIQCDRKGRMELSKREISANDAIREALSVYESLGEIRRQEAAYSYFQLACYQKDCCLRFLESDHEKSNGLKGDNSRVKQYASLAERNWQRAIDFYGPETHPTMYMTILLERSALLFSLSSSLRSNAMLESALSLLLEGCHLSETCANSLRTDFPELHDKFWSQLQMVLKRMLSLTISTNGYKSSASSQPVSSSNRSGDTLKLRELYKLSLKSADLSQLHAMQTLWAS